MDENHEGLELGITSILMQQMRRIYPLEMGLKAGTIFPELDKPFLYGNGRYSNARKR